MKAKDVRSFKIMPEFLNARCPRVERKP